MEVEDEIHGEGGGGEGSEIIKIFNYDVVFEFFHRKLKEKKDETMRKKEGHKKTNSKTK